MKGSCLCFGIPLDRATLYVAISDVIIGASSFILFAIHLKMINDGTDDDFCCNVFNFLFRRRPHKFKQTGDDNNLRVPPWLPVVLLVCSVIQCLMGFVLAVGTAKKSRRVCRFWIFITGITCIFTFFLLRIYQMLVVSEFCHELANERRSSILHNSFRINTHFNGNHSANNSNQTQHHHQISIAMNTSGQSHFTGNSSFSANAHYHYQPSFFVPPTPPSLVPSKQEDDDPPPSYLEATSTQPATKRY